MGGWRFLIDEDTDADTASELEKRGYDAVTVTDSVGEGSLDPEIADYAIDTNRLLITTDRDFLDGEQYPDIQVLLVTDSSAVGYVIADQVDELAQLAADPSELRRITWI